MHLSLRALMATRQVQLSTAIEPGSRCSTTEAASSMFPYCCPSSSRKRSTLWCQLLGYVSRAVRPSVSYNDAKRTIPIREKQQKHSRSNQSNKFENKLILRGRVRQRRESRSGVKSSIVHKERRIGAEKPLGSRYRRQEAHSIREKEAPMTQSIT